MSNIKENAKETLEAGKDTVKSTIQNDETQQNWQRTKDAARNTIESTKQAAYETFDDVRGSASNLEDYVTDYIQTNPWKSVGIAMLSGLVIGKFMR